MIINQRCPWIYAGVLAILPQDDIIESLMEQADTSCYIARRKCRNQIHLHTVS